MDDAVNLSGQTVLSYSSHCSETYPSLSILLLSVLAQSSPTDSVPAKSWSMTRAILSSGKADARQTKLNLCGQCVDCARQQHSSDVNCHQPCRRFPQFFLKPSQDLLINN